jgi:drug/metabolite transporter (DMT)-like permease
MTLGYLFLIASLIGFGALGIFHKVADHPTCRPRIITMLLLMWGAVLTGAYTALSSPLGLHIPSKVLGIGAVGGVLASLALFAFQASLRFGKISTSWLILNLCVAVPVVLSIVVYGEKVNGWKWLGMLLVLGAIFLLWWDKKKDLERTGTEQSAPGAGRTLRWLPLIMLAFLANGLAASSQLVLVKVGGGDYVWQFYVVLYAAGCAVMALTTLVHEGRPNRREFVTAAAMGVASVAGNIAMVKALANQVPGPVAYPVGNGGSLFLVVLAGVLLFKEHVNPVGIAGIAVGIGAVLVLVLS